MPDHTTSRFKRPPQSCEQCGKLFQPISDGRRYCSKQCYGATLSRPAAERFHERYTTGDGCWEWQGALNEHGYGRFHFRGSMQIASRVAWVLAYGEIPDGMHVCHHCDNPRCVRPDHLFLGTRTDNARDMAAKGRQVFQRNPQRAPRGDRNGSRQHPEALVRGVLHHRAKLTDDDVRRIRELHQQGYSNAEIGRHFGVTRATIRSIVIGQTWTHL